MESRKASDTAAFTAMLRAAHQLIDDEPRIVDDPIAVRLVEDATPERIAARRAALLSPGLRVPRAAVVLCSRYPEDLLAQAVERGVGQFVILGAGLDTFAYRQPAFTRGLEIYEVDSTVTQAWKRELLTAASIVARTIFIGRRWISSSRGSPRGSEQQDSDTSRPAFFSWLGVTQYLTLTAIDATLDVVAALPSPSTIVLNFMLPDADLPSEEAVVARAVAEDAATKGEPWLTRISPMELAARLANLGFREVTHLTSEEADARYFAGRRDGLRAPYAAQLINATT